MTKIPLPASPPASGRADFSTVTELPGNHASAEQLSMIHTRYRWAWELAAGKDVLEVACGAGWGLGYLAQRARTIVGGDCMQSLVDLANQHYGGRLQVQRLDAEALPFPNESFDLVLLFEALYYIPRAENFFREAKRVLRPGGTLLLCTPNKEWSGFNPSPFSVRYYSASELVAALQAEEFISDIKAAFETRHNGIRQQFISLIRRVAILFGLVPKTMRGKVLFKRFFYGRLAELGPEIDTSVPVTAMRRVGPGPVTGYKILYASARKA